MSKLEFHPLANIFPLMEGKEFDDLCEDIAENGQLEPIWLDDENRILDGRNRYRACTEMGIRPRTKRWVGGDALQFVVSLNLHRRHLTESQRANVAANIATKQQGKRNDLGDDEHRANLHEVSTVEAAH